MPTKISSYLTDLGFKQLEKLSDATQLNNKTAGEFIVVKQNNRIYRFDGNSTLTVDSNNVLNTSDGGNTRWICIGGTPTTQVRIQYTFEEESNQIPLGTTISRKEDIIYVNISNTNVLSSEYDLNATKDTIVFKQSFKSGIEAEILIIHGDYANTVGNYDNLINKPSINGIELTENKTLDDLNIQEKGDYQLAGNYVTTDTNQAITSHKTFVGGIDTKANNVDVTTAPTADVYHDALEIRDVNNVRYGIISTTQTPNNQVQTKLMAQRTIDGVVKYSVIRAAVDADGTTSTYAITPSISSNNTNIATTAYINTKFQTVSVLPANPNVNVYYFIPE